MPAPAQTERIAVLWQLTWGDTNTLACSVYRDGNRMLLCLESNSAVVVSERFDLQPRAVARAQALRESLKRRGWCEAPIPAVPAAPGDAPV